MLKIFFKGLIFSHLQVFGLFAEIVAWHVVARKFGRKAFLLIPQVFIVNTFIALILIENKEMENKYLQFLKDFV